MPDTGSPHQFRRGGGRVKVPPAIMSEIERLGRLILLGELTYDDAIDALEPFLNKEERDSELRPRRDFPHLVLLATARPGDEER